jgi:hypothetical protein
MLVNSWTNGIDAEDHQVHLTCNRYEDELLSSENSSAFDNATERIRESCRANAKRNLTALLALGFIFYAIGMSILVPHVKQWILGIDLAIIGAGMSLSLVPTLFLLQQ